MDIVPTSNEILAPPLTLDYEHVLCPSLSDLKLEDTMHNPQVDDYITALSPNKIIERESFCFGWCIWKIEMFLPVDLWIFYDQVYSWWDSCGRPILERCQQTNWWLYWRFSKEQVTIKQKLISWNLRQVGCMFRFLSRKSTSMLRFCGCFANC